MKKIKGRIMGFEKDRIFIIFRSGTKIAILGKDELIKNIQNTRKIGDIIELFANDINIILNPKITKKPSSLIEIDGILYI